MPSAVATPGDLSDGPAQAEKAVAEIRQLSSGVVNKIAAGEVIERPASIVKELMENAVDAGAARIDVALEGGGAELVRVVDDGCGVSPEQLPLAVASHATSKIRDADDLFRINTLGFRGEALASIASVSQFTMRSRANEADAGYELQVAGGEQQPVAPCGCPRGTVVEVRSLFYNTPVRRKFLRTTPTELGHATEAFNRIALAHPQVHFTLTHNGRTVHELPVTENLRGRVAALSGEDLAEALIWIESEDGPLRLSGYVAHPEHSRSHNRMQYVFLNGRFIRDRALQHALGEAYRGLLLHGRYPICFLHFEMPPEDVDVNVHPTKLEVRFADSGRLYSQLLGTLRSRFLTTDLTARFHPTGEEAQVPAAADDAQVQQVKQDFVQWAKGQLGDASAAEPASGTAQQQDIDLPFEPSPARLELQRIDRPWPAANNSGEQTSQHLDDTPVPNAGNAAPPPALARPEAMQIHNRYLVTENDEGVLVIDQHALHERILYEQIREKVLAGELETQKLLVPEPVHLSSAECAAALEHQKLLGQLGIEIQHFGGDSVLVSAYPAMLANLDPADMLRQLIEQIQSAPKQPDRRDVLDELLHSLSCRAAIKAGDRLSGEEIAALLELREQYSESHHCPHGRPTSLVFTREELDRRFKRI